MNEEEQIPQANKILSQFAYSLLKLELSSDFNNVVDLVVSQRGNGKIITTGMGKAGIAMRKFSSTLCSLGFSSVYMHPGEAMHGDLGVVDSNDILFVASTSGKTREVVEVIDLARNVKVKSVIGITSHADSVVRKKSDHILDMGIVEEAGHLGLAPTTSIIIMLAITDCIAIIASESAGITKEDYSKYHHCGYLGSMARGDKKIY